MNSPHVHSSELKIPIFFFNHEVLNLVFFFFSPIDGFGYGKRLAIVKTRNRSGDYSGIPGAGINMGDLMINNQSLFY